MKFNFICPDCGMKVSPLQHCACNQQESALDTEEEQIDYQCAFRFDGQRCRLPGTISSYLHMTGPWYCREHWLILYNFILAEIVPNYSEISYLKIMEAHRDWRETLLAENSLFI